MRDKPLVLIIDDEDDIRDIVRVKLEANKFQVEDASNGPDGIKKATEFIPDIILLDVVMPEMDGVSVFFKLQENPVTKGIKTLFFTGKGDPQSIIVEASRRFAQQSGAFDFVRKEIDLDDLVKKLSGIWNDIRGR
ncbi:two-component system response regulator [Candidatus Wolfebacteria bacterium CG10_big_fil_rev_8_21_14_0_10_31_9]|uniref:Two-component system response regulator n=1 Tax=Candidatus Wolfebacteria bacterium CG10_big_fil_rev_8_21_14_0_10_31_9 TaxID=1975070 RepID=A0A2H0RCS1_9BACT|nr:MAG: two-component system response regulator [Candidatus Wolfebacteria bacterium CG10_big_fil_rev_8_21_14_0_10_31_9]